MTKKNEWKWNTKQSHGLIHTKTFEASIPRVPIESTQKLLTISLVLYVAYYLIEETERQVERCERDITQRGCGVLINTLSFLLEIYTIISI